MKHRFYDILRTAEVRTDGPAIKSPEGFILHWSKTVPTDGASGGFAPGCILIHTDGAAGSQLYINEGSATSNSFRAIPTLATANNFTSYVAVGSQANVVGSGLTISAA